MTSCIAPNCAIEAAIDSPLCHIHRDELQKIEADILKNATRVISAEVRQFERLLYIEPPLTAADIAFRMAVPVKEVRKLLKRFREERE